MGNHGGGANAATTARLPAHVAHEPPPWQGPATHVAPEARTALEGAFGRPLSDRTIRAMAGAPPSADVTVAFMPIPGPFSYGPHGEIIPGAPRGYRVNWYVWGPPLAPGTKPNEQTRNRQYDQMRHLTLNPQRRLSPGADMINDHFTIAPSERGRGLGSTSLMAQVQTLSHLGQLDQITTFAGKWEDTKDPGNAMNGYYTWPILGYNGPLRPGIRATLDRTMGELAPATRARLRAMTARGQTLQIRDIIATPDGLRWWQKHGEGHDVSFNLKRYSSDRQHMARYIRARRAQGRPVHNPARWR